jgi:hypothetical protein
MKPKSQEVESDRAGLRADEQITMRGNFATLVAGAPLWILLFWGCSLHVLACPLGYASRIHVHIPRVDVLDMVRNIFLCIRPGLLSSSHGR